MSGLKALSTFVLTAATLLSFAARTGEGWGTLRPDGSVFSVSLPGRPLIESHQENQPGVGSVSMSTYHLVAGNVVYMIEDMGFASDSPFLRVPAKTSLANVENSYAKSSNATIVSVQFGKVQGYDVLVMMLKRDDVYFRGLTINAGTHNLIVLAAADQTTINSPAVTHFLSTFRIVNI